MNAAAGTTRPERPEQRTGSEARQIADALIRARLDRTPIPPFTRRLPFLRVDTAYEAQSLVVRHRLEAGERMIGAKLGLTSRVKRQALGIHEPVFGRLTSGMVVPHGQALQLDELIHPRAEPEIAFLIGKRIEAPTTVAQVLAATEAVFPAIEVVDSRYSEPFRLPGFRGRQRRCCANRRRRPRPPAGSAGRSQRPGLRLPVPWGDRHRGRRRRHGPPGRGAGVAGGGTGRPGGVRRTRVDRACRAV